VVAKYHPLITCSISFVLCFVCMLISYVMYATKCLNKINEKKMKNGLLRIAAGSTLDCT